RAARCARASISDPHPSPLTLDTEPSAGADRPGRIGGAQTGQVQARPPARGARPHARRVVRARALLGDAAAEGRRAGAPGRPPALALPRGGAGAAVAGGAPARYLIEAGRARMDADDRGFGGVSPPTLRGGEGGPA